MLAAVQPPGGAERKQMVLSVDDAEESIEERFDLEPVTENVEVQVMKKDAVYRNKRNKDAMQEKFSNADTTCWSNDDPPRIWTVKFRAKKRSQMLEVTPDDSSINNYHEVPAQLQGDLGRKAEGNDDQGSGR
jgi:hypothetical protein